MYFLDDGKTIPLAISRLEPTILALIKEFNREGVYILVASGDPKTTELEKAIKYEQSFGGESFKKMAYAKAREAYKGKISSGIIAKFYPERLNAGDTIWNGAITSDVENDPEVTVVSISGLKEYQDKLLAEMIFLMIRMIAYEKVELLKENKKGIISE